MRQQTLASQASFEKYGRKGKRELYLDQMNCVAPWPELLALAEPYYHKAGNGRQPVGLAIPLRTYFLRQWFNLSDPGKVRYRGLKKNHQWLCAAFALVNLYQHRSRLAPQRA
jgi:hypothetical protein